MPKKKKLKNDFMKKQFEGSLSCFFNNKSHTSNNNLQMETIEI